MRRLINDNRGVTLIWVLCLMVVVFIIGVSVMTAAAFSTGVALRYNTAKNCFYYSKALSKAITSDIVEGFSIAEGDPWRDIAQSVYDVKAVDSTGSAMLRDPLLNIEALNPPNGASFDGSAEINITLQNQSRKMVRDYSLISTTDIYDNVTETENLEITEVYFDMIIELRTFYEAQEYRIFLKYRFEGYTLGVPGQGKGSGRIIKDDYYQSGYKYLGCFDSI